LEGVFGLAQAFGDFNSDKFTDIFVVSQDKTQVSVYFWNTESYKFEISGAVIGRLQGISQIIPGDFNYDGKLDLLIVQDGPANRVFTIYPGDTNDFGTPLFSTNFTGGDLLAFDWNGDLQTDLFASNGAGKRVVWENQGAGTFIQVESFSSPYPLWEPNSHSFVDVNGDCLADLVLTSENCTSSCTKQLEIWINNGKEAEWRLDKIIALPFNAGQISWADFNGDGTMDFMYGKCVERMGPGSSCNGSGFDLWLNSQIPLCTGFSFNPTNCRPSSKLCSADQDYSFKLYEYTPSMVGDMQFFMHPSFPFLSLRTGDFNVDGYVDILVSQLDKDLTPMVQLWKNIPCPSDAASCPPGATRTFTSNVPGSQALSNIGNAFSASFFDFDEDGQLDIFVLCEGCEGEEDPSHFGMKAVLNNYFNDAYFLKALSLNGVCPAWCTTGPKFPSPKPYGVNFPGATWKFTLSDLEGNNRVITGNTLIQSGGLALQTPYSFFGLGRTANYIETVFVGIPYNSKDYFASWICIIPNAQLVAIPYPPDKIIEWSLELYIRSSGITLWVTLSVVICLIIVGIIISILTWKERREDKQARLQEDTSFMF